MKNFKTFLVVVFMFATLLNFAQSKQNDFFGMWTLEIEGGAVGWLELHEKQGFLDADLLWRGGSVTPVSHVYFVNKNTY